LSSSLAIEKNERSDLATKKDERSDLATEKDKRSDLTMGWMAKGPVGISNKDNSRKIIEPYRGDDGETYPGSDDREG
jgi:hypothetical protein